MSEQPGEVAMPVAQSELPGTQQPTLPPPDLTESPPKNRDVEVLKGKSAAAILATPKPKKKGGEAEAVASTSTIQTPATPVSKSNKRKSTNSQDNGDDTPGSDVGTPSKQQKVSSEKQKFVVEAQVPGVKSVIGICDSKDLQAQKLGQASARSRRNDTIIHPSDETDETDGTGGDGWTMEYDAASVSDFEDPSKVTTLFVSPVFHSVLQKTTEDPQCIYFINPHSGSQFRIRRPPVGDAVRAARLADHSFFRKSLNELRTGCVQAAFGSMVTDAEFRLMDFSAVRNFFPSLISKELDIKSTTGRQINRDAKGNFTSGSKPSFSSKPETEDERVSKKIQTFKTLRAACDKGLAALDKHKPGSRQRKDSLDTPNDIRILFHEELKELPSGERNQFVDSMHDLLTGTAEMYRVGLAAMVIFGKRLESETAERLGVLMDVMASVDTQIEKQQEFHVDPWMIEAISPGHHICHCDTCTLNIQNHLERSLHEKLLREAQAERLTSVEDEPGQPEEPAVPPHVADFLIMGDGSRRNRDIAILKKRENEIFIHGMRGVEEVDKASRQQIRLVHNVLEDIEWHVEHRSNLENGVDHLRRLMSTENSQGREEAMVIPPPQTPVVSPNFGCDMLEALVTQVKKLQISVRREVVKREKPINMSLRREFVPNPPDWPKWFDGVQNNFDLYRRAEGFMLISLLQAWYNGQDVKKVWRLEAEDDEDTRVRLENAFPRNRKIMPLFSTEYDLQEGIGPLNQKLQCCGNEYDTVELLMEHQYTERANHMNATEEDEWLQALRQRQLDLPVTEIRGQLNPKDFSAETVVVESTFPWGEWPEQKRPAEYCAESILDVAPERRAMALSIRTDPKWIRLNTPVICAGEPWSMKARTEMPTSDVKKYWRKFSSEEVRDLNDNPEFKRERDEFMSKWTAEVTKHAQRLETTNDDEVVDEPDPDIKEQKLRQRRILRRQINPVPLTETESAYRRMRAYPNERFKDDGTYVETEFTKEGLPLPTWIGPRYDGMWNLYRRDGEMWCDHDGLVKLLTDHIGGVEFDPPLTKKYITDLFKFFLKVAKAGVAYHAREVESYTIKIQLNETFMKFWGKDEEHPHHEYALREGFGREYHRSRALAELRDYRQLVETHKAASVSANELVDYWKKQNEDLRQRLDSIPDPPESAAAFFGPTSTSQGNPVGYADDSSSDED